MEIEIDTSAVSKRDSANGPGQSHVAEDIINYPGNAHTGKLIYIKTSLNGDEPIDIKGYKMQNPKFPQQPISEKFLTKNSL